MSSIIGDLPAEKLKKDVDNAKAIIDHLKSTYDRFEDGELTLKEKEEQFEEGGDLLCKAAEDYSKVSKAPCTVWDIFRKAVELSKPPTEPEEIKKFNQVLDGLVKFFVAAGHGIDDVIYELFGYERMPSVVGTFENSEKTLSPVAIDLNSDGINTLSQESEIFFDHDNNGMAEQTGWVVEDDGLLVLDRNNDGLINNGSELFGNNTLLTDGTNASN